MENLEQKVNELFEDSKMSVYEAAKRLGVKEIDVLKLRGNDEFKLVGGDKFDEVISELCTWGDVLFIKNTPEFIIELKLRVSTGKRAQGFYNFSGESAGVLGGHLRDDLINNIGFVSTKFMGLLGHSIHFYDAQGNVIFKIFVNRDSKMMLDKEQTQKFLSLKDRL